MAWSIRKSVRLPMGFRLNLSKHGFGWSGGVRHFRIGRDSLGRKYSYISLGKTGIYRRDYYKDEIGDVHHMGTTEYNRVGCLGWIIIVAVLWYIIDRL